jgi:hypothetical protein
MKESTPGYWSGAVAVQFIHPGNQEIIRLTYRVIKTNDGWRENTRYSISQWGIPPKNFNWATLIAQEKTIKDQANSIMIFIMLRIVAAARQNCNLKESRYIEKLLLPHALRKILCGSVVTFDHNSENRDAPPRNSWIGVK